ncbi:MAG: hypothetical protein P8Y48_16505 [Novosphingobium sp.]
MGAHVRRSGCTFSNRSMMGDRMTFVTIMTPFGMTSFDLRHIVTCRGEVRQTANQTLLFTDFSIGQPQEIPRDLRPRMERHLAPDTAESSSPIKADAAK